jgi:hypothetical protein
MSNRANDETPLLPWERYIFGFDPAGKDEACEVSAIYNVLTKQLRIVDVEFTE